MRSGLIYVLIAMVVISFSSGAVAIRKAQTAASNATLAVCSLKTGYVKQLADTERYLDSPKLFATLHAIGVTRADLLTQRNSLRKRVSDLSRVEC